MKVAFGITIENVKASVSSILNHAMRFGDGGARSHAVRARALCAGRDGARLDRADRAGRGCGGHAALDQCQRTRPGGPGALPQDSRKPDHGALRGLSQLQKKVDDARGDRQPNDAATSAIGSRYTSRTRSTRLTIHTLETDGLSR